MGRPNARVTGKGGGVGSNQYQTRGVSRAGVKRPAPERGYGDAPPAVQEWANKRFKDPEHAKAFSRWFGDSKVVDANGHPLTVYHGTKAEFNEFRGAGYFSPDESYAKDYADSANVIRAYVAIKNPLITSEARYGMNDDLWDQVKAVGHDGIVYNYKDGSVKAYIAFDSKQIKSATGNRGTFSKRRGNINLSIDAVPTLHINRTINPTSSPTPPDIPSADEIAEQTIGYLEELYREIEDRLLAGQPIGDLAEKIDRLVAQAELASRIAGAVGVWHDSREPRLYTLDALGPLPTKRFPWIENAARWLMDRGVYSAEEIQAQARGEFEPRWKSLEAVTLVRNEIANGFVVGETFEEFHKRIRDKVAATKPELQNAFRTATHSAYIHGTTNTLEKPLVKLQFPFVRYRSAHDTRTRATHRPLDGLLFEVGSDAYVIMRRALADFNCRCSITSLTAEKAAAKKLTPVEVDDLPAEVLAKYGRA